jgi:hypothetical protein
MGARWQTQHPKAHAVLSRLLTITVFSFASLLALSLAAVIAACVLYVLALVVLH